jgi:hypothetical protein
MIHTASIAARPAPRYGIHALPLLELSATLRNPTSVSGSQLTSVTG